MQVSIPKSLWRIFNVMACEILFFALLYHAFVLISSPSPDPWIIGDWLINYQGGIVRRGLIGEVFFRISQWSGLDIVTFIVTFQVFIYLIFFINTCRLAIRSRFSARNAALIYSPAFMLFPILDPLGGFRKEILLFALLSTLCYWFTTSNTETSKNLPIYIGVAAAILVLSHEILVVYLPYVICGFILRDKGFSGQARKTALYSIPAVAIAVLLMLFGRGDQQTVVDICHSLETNAPLDCISPETEPGAISYLGKNTAAAHEFVLESIGADTLPIYGITASLSFVPVILAFFSKQSTHLIRNKQVLFWFAICVSSAIVGSLPLFWVAADYGRFVYMHVVCLSLLALMLTLDNDDTPLLLNLKQVAAWVLCVLFIISWRLYHWKTSADIALPFQMIRGFSSGK